MKPRWLACIVTEDGLRLYVKGVVPKRTTTPDPSLASRFPTEDHAVRMAQLMCPGGGRYGAERAVEEVDGEPQPSLS
jgi:hypothetical protein